MPIDEEEVMMTGASSKDKLLVSSQDKVAIVACTVSTSRSTTVLTSTTGTAGSEAADGLLISNLETTFIELGVASTSYSISNPQR